MKKTIGSFAVVGAILPLVLLMDLNFLGGFVSDYTPLVLVLWPSSFLLSGFTKITVAATIGLVISVGINIVLYGLVGFLLSSAYLFLVSRSRSNRMT